MIVRCPNCQKRLKVPADMAGRRIGCNACRTPIDLPTEAPATPDPAFVAEMGPPSTALELPAVADLAPPPPVATPAPPRTRKSAAQELGDIDPPDNRAWIDRFVSAGIALLLQALLFLGFAIFSGSREMAGEDAGVAVTLAALDSETLTDTDDGQLEEASAAGGSDASELTTNVEVAVAPAVADAADGIDLSLSPTGGSSGGGWAGGGDGFGFGKGGGTGGEANFLGVPGRGHRFCIIADNSGSMTGAMNYLKVEVNKTLNAARGSAKFYIVFFNSVAHPQPVKKWVSGKKDVDALAAWVQGVRAGGGTEPITGFEAAFEIDPPPDVIYFMTDGGFNPQQVRQIKALNAKLKKPATIHGIAFGRGAAVPLIRQIAKDSNGTFRTVNGP